MPSELTRAEYHRLIKVDLEHIDELNSLIKQAKSENKPAVNLYKDLIRASEKHIKHMRDYQKDFNEPYEIPSTQSDPHTQTQSETGNADSGIENQSISTTKPSQQDQHLNEQPSLDVEEPLPTPKTKHPFNRARHTPNQAKHSYHYSSEIATPAISYEYDYTTTNAPP